MSTETIDIGKMFEEYTAYMMLLAQALPKKYGYNACVAVGEDGNKAGLEVHNEHVQKGISSNLVFLYADADNGIFMEAINEYKGGDKEKSSILLRTGNTRIISPSYDLYCEQEKNRWMTGFMNPDLNIAFEWMKNVNNILTDQAIDTSDKTGDIAANAASNAGVSAELSTETTTLDVAKINMLYNIALSQKDYLLATFNPLGLALMQAVITETPRYMTSKAMPDHTHIDYEPLIVSKALEYASGIKDDGTMPVASGPLTFSLNLSGLGTLSGDGLSEGYSDLGMGKKDLGQNITCNKPKISGKLLFKKPEDEYFGVMPKTLINNLKSLTKE